VISDAIFTLGQAHAGLVALIGTNLFPVAEKREHQVSRVVYDVDDQEPVAGIWQDSGWYHTRVTFSCYGATQREAALVAAQVRACYQRFHGTSTGHAIDDVKATGSGSSYFDPELEQFVEELELEFFHD
jgi:hypothetical protein